MKLQLHFLGRMIRSPLMAWRNAVKLFKMLAWTTWSVSLRPVSGGEFCSLRRLPRSAVLARRVLHPKDSRYRSCHCVPGRENGLTHPASGAGLLRRGFAYFE